LAEHQDGGTTLAKDLDNFLASVSTESLSENDLDQLTENLYFQQAEKQKVSEECSDSEDNIERELTDDFIKYGDTIYIQNGGQNFRWLSGSRSARQESVITRNLHGGDYEIGIRDTYKWIITDPNNGTVPRCLKYGEVFALKNSVADTDRYLRICCSGNAGVITRDPARSGELLDEKYHYVARSTLEETDPADGVCIETLSQVYLKSEYMQNRWLTGARSDRNEGVVFRNMLGSNYELGLRDTYKWILKHGPGRHDRTDALECAAYGASGKWETRGYTNGQNAYEFTEGVSTSRTTTDTFESSLEWEVSVTNSITSGFEYLSFTGGEFEVSATIAGSYTTTIEHAVQRTENKEETQTITFDEPGQVWQFVYSVHDVCVDQPWDLLTNNLVTTDRRGEPPCCLPGHAKNPSIQHGPCEACTPCFCSDEICNQ